MTPIKFKDSNNESNKFKSVLSKKPNQAKNTFKVIAYQPEPTIPKWKEPGQYIVFRNKISIVNQASKSKTKKNKRVPLIFYTNINIEGGLSNFNCKILELFQLILKGSKLFDSQKKLLVKNDGTFEFFGHSPAGYLMVTYFSLNLIPTRKSSTHSLNLINVAHIKARSNLLELELNQAVFLSQCVDAYFDSFHYFFPVIDEQAFRTKPNPLLLKAVVAIGYKYVSDLLPDPEMTSLLDLHLLQEFEASFFKPNTDLVTCLTIISQFQALLSHCEKQWMYQNTATHISLMLGLNKPLPKNLALSDKEIRHRYNQWWACCSQDKYFTMACNRPMIIAPRGWRVPYPELPRIDFLPSTPDTKSYKRVKELASSIYWIDKAMISEVVGYVNIYRTKHLDSNANKKRVLLDDILARLERINAYFFKKMKQVYLNQPDWVFPICNEFSLHHTLLHNNLIIEATNHYIRIPNATDRSHYEKLGIIAAKTILLAAELLGNSFLRYGVASRFVCISNATLTFTKLLCFNQAESAYWTNLFEDDPCFSNTAELFVEKGLNILLSAIPYFPVLAEFINLIKKLINSE